MAVPIIALAAALASQPAPVRAASLPDTGLDGRWASGCIVIGQDGRHGTILRATIVGRRVDVLAQTYAHATCDKPTIRSRLRARIDAATMRGGEIDATLRVNSITMTPQAADVVRIWNVDRAAKQCADRPWHLNEAQSVAGRTCAGALRFPAHGATIHVPVEQEGGRLLVPSPMGRHADGSAARIELTRLQ